MPIRILVGIGGTGAKCIEAAVHLAVSEPGKYTLYPIVIDQDKMNGNILKLKDIIKSYRLLTESGAGSGVDWPFSNTIEYYEKLLPIAPVDDDITFGAAIGEPSMEKEEKLLINALYTRNQLNDTILNQGFKKRAHMGSILFERFINVERKRSEHEPGLNFIVNKVKNETDVSVYIFASLFGGTGISGFVNVGKFFKESLEQADVNVVLFSPYFKISSAETNNPDTTIVKSDKDMLATRIALEIYGKEIQKVFNKTFLIGSDIETVGDEFVSDKPNLYGSDQKNRGHVFELMAASLVFNDYLKDNGFYNFFLPTTGTKEKPPVKIGAQETIEWNSFLDILKIKKDNFKTMLKFAILLSEIRRNNLKDSWIKRQPWIKIDDLPKLIDWGERYLNWFEDMEKWKIFNIELKKLFAKPVNVPYITSAKLSSYLQENDNSLKNLFKTLEILSKEWKE